MIEFTYLTADGEEKTGSIDEKFAGFYIGTLRTKVEQFTEMARLTSQVAEGALPVKADEDDS